MGDRPAPNPDDFKARDIADAEALFGETPTTRDDSPPPIRPGGEGESHYEVADVEEPPVRPSLKIVPPEERRAQRPPQGMGGGLEPSQAVEQVWSRGAEWGGTLAKVGAVAFGFLILVYLLLSSEQFGLAFLVFVASMPALALLSYPILITLERPVRVTPEQAVRDYLTALSHHVPHYRRMWLLLSNAGRVSGEFASFDGFKGYWDRRLAELRGERTSRFTPLKFQVDDFKSEKSAGKTEIDVEYVVKVYVRGRQREGPVETVPVSTTLVKGPDRMWYLNRGTLP
jgi:hypothetical protein